MKRRIIRTAFNLSISLLLFSSTVQAQEGLFDSKELLKLKIKGNIEALMSDRGEDASYHDLSIEYYTVGMQTLTVDLKARTRGNFRRQKANCVYPPILLNFKKSDEKTQTSIFKGQDQMKLVTPCQGDKYVVREHMVYEVYNLFTDQSFKSRLVELTFIDEESEKESKPQYGVILESEEGMAERNAMEVNKSLGVLPQKTDVKSFHRMAVFQYFIGNTDWSVQYRHNIKLMAKDSTMNPIPVPYDFDHAGLVYTPYAKPAPALELLAVQERRYRGYCQGAMTIFEPVFEEFNSRKTEIYNLYTSNKYLTGSYKNWARRYLDKFYKVINNPKKSKREFIYPCDPNGTGNVVIRGMGD